MKLTRDDLDEAMAKFRNEIAAKNKVIPRGIPDQFKIETIVVKAAVEEKGIPRKPKKLMLQGGT